MKGKLPFFFDKISIHSFECGRKVIEWYQRGPLEQFVLTTAPLPGQYNMKRAQC